MIMYYKIKTPIEERVIKSDAADPDMTPRADWTIVQEYCYDDGEETHPFLERILKRPYDIEFIADTPTAYDKELSGYINDCISIGHTINYSGWAYSRVKHIKLKEQNG